MLVWLNDRPITDTVRDVFTMEGHVAPPVAVRTVQPLANAASVFGTGASVAPREIRIVLDVWPDTVVERVTVMDTLTRRAGGLRVLRVQDSPTREQWAHLTAVNVEYYHQAIPRCAVTLTFTALDPVRYECQARAVALSTSRAAVSLGTMATAPLVWLYGASPSVVNPVVIVRAASGEESHRITLAGTLATNDALLLDTGTQTITRTVAGVVQTGANSGNAWLVSGQFPTPDPTESVDGDGVTVELSSTSGTPTGLILYARGY
jgi:hypothetical protein